MIKAGHLANSTIASAITSVPDNSQIMNVEPKEIRVRGKTVQVPSIQINDRTVIVTGKWIKLASVHEEKTLEGEGVRDPEHFIDRLRASQLHADIFTFAQKIPETKPKYHYPFEWDNVAAIPISTCEDWLGKRAATDVKQNVKKASKRGVVVRPVQFDDPFVKGIVDIYNESPIRQGRPFWHYGKDFNTVKRETAHCLARSHFIGAYVQEELIGFIKLLNTDSVADIVLIVSKQKHFDKRPTNALIAKAVEVCVHGGMRYLTYAKYAYGNKANSSLAEFKRRHGFEQIRFPRYYVPLTGKGRIVAKLKLYRSIEEMLPENILNALLNLRSRLYKSAVFQFKLSREAKNPRLEEGA